MVRLIPISYKNKKYPDGIVPKIEEISKISRELGINRNFLITLLLPSRKSKKYLQILVLMIAFRSF